MPVQKRTEDIQELRLKDGKNLFLTVIIGNAQIGASVVKFKGSSDILAKGEIVQLDIGNAADIAGKKLRVVTRVLDANEATNKIIVTHEFENGTPASFSYEDEVEENQDVFTLTTDYKLI